MSRALSIVQNLQRQLHVIKFNKCEMSSISAIILKHRHNDKQKTDNNRSSHRFLRNTIFLRELILYTYIVLLCHNTPWSVWSPSYPLQTSFVASALCEEDIEQICFVLCMHYLKVDRAFTTVCLNTQLAELLCRTKRVLIENFGRIFLIMNIKYYHIQKAK